MTVASERHASRGGSRFGGALLSVLAILLISATAAACSPTAATPGGPADTTRPAAPSPAGSIASPGPTGPSPVAAELLAAALEPLRAASAFETKVTVDGEVVVSATGRSAGRASKATVTTADRTVEYVRVPPRAWAREPGAKWVLVDATTAPAGPLETLSKPATLVPVTSASGTATFTATYPAATLGMTGDPVTVTITADGKAVTFTYEATTAGRTTVSTTTLRPAAADPIVAPGA